MRIFFPSDYVILNHFIMRFVHQFQLNLKAENNNCYIRRCQTNLLDNKFSNSERSLINLTIMMTRPSVLK
jgi:hypothetical protein